MLIQQIKPLPELAGSIERFWTFESADGLPPGVKHIVPPNGCAKLVIPVENEIESESGKGTGCSVPGKLYFVGNQDNPALLSTQRRKTLFVTIEFKPQGAYRIFGVPMGELANSLCSIDSVFGVLGRETTDSVGDGQRTSEKVAAVQKALAKALHSHPRSSDLVDYCVDSLKRTQGLMPVSELARRTGYTGRYLEVLFKQHVGLSPKALAGIFRFQRFHCHWARGTPYEVLREELDGYYYDQAHFTREFKRLTGFPPRRYMQDLSNDFGRRIVLG